MDMMRQDCCMRQTKQELTMRLKTMVVLLLACLQMAWAQGWKAGYDGVMLQGFYWDSYDETSWRKLTADAPEIGRSFSLVWVPQSGNCNSADRMMGYTPVYYFDQNSSFGTEAELREMISRLRENGCGVIADVVINHRNNLGKNGSWVDFPAEAYRGRAYAMLPTDICANDDGGSTRQWAASNGISLSGNDDTGEDWSGCRDLDHQSANVQECIKAYLKFLLDDIGYTGFRYDMVKGFWASFIADYNCYAKPGFSVGEYWDSKGKIREWIDYTRGYVSSTPTSAAFDFQFRYNVRDAANSGDWSRLSSSEAPLALESAYKQYAVTFVENHDTEKRSGSEQDPLRKDTLAANAYMLAMSGTPCVFYKHWRDCKGDISQMIAVRRLAGITNTSDSHVLASCNSYHAVSTGDLLCVVGNRPQDYSVSSAQYAEVITGHGYRYLMRRTANTVWMDKLSGDYTAPLQVVPTAIAPSTAKLVYTTDGSVPTAASRQAVSGRPLTLEESCVLRMGVLVNGQVVGIQSRQYNLMAPHEVTVRVRSTVSWPTMCFYMWDSRETPLCGQWPGKRITSTEVIDGKRWYTHTVSVDSPQGVGLVVNTGSNARQTVDFTGIREDCYLLINGKKDGNKYLVQDVTDEVLTDVSSPQVSLRTSGISYGLDGKVATPGTRGVVVRDGRKVLQHH